MTRADDQSFGSALSLLLLLGTLVLIGLVSLVGPALERLRSDRRTRDVRLA
jgi:hypothetical protein